MTTEAAEALAFALLTTPRPLAEWHEDMGPQLWWCWESPKPFERISEYVVSCAHDGRWLGEPPYVGTPLDLGPTVEAEMILRRHGEPELTKVFREQVGGWPGYHTHFTPLPPMPKVPVPFERKWTGPGHLEQTGYIEVPK